MTVPPDPGALPAVVQALGSVLALVRRILGMGPEPHVVLYKPKQPPQQEHLEWLHAAGMNIGQRRAWGKTQDVRISKTELRIDAKAPLRMRYTDWQENPILSVNDEWTIPLVVRAKPPDSKRFLLLKTSDGRRLFINRNVAYVTDLAMTKHLDVANLTILTPRRIPYDLELTTYYPLGNKTTAHLQVSVTESESAPITIEGPPAPPTHD